MNIPWQTSSRFIQHVYPLLMGISPRVMCVVCGGGGGCVLVPRDVKLIKETNKKQLIMSAHLCSWLVFLFLIHLFALFCPFFALFGWFCCSCLLFLAHISLLFASSGLSLAFWIFFLLMSALSGFFFCLFLYLFALVLAHFCIFVLMSALVCSIRLFVARWLFFAENCSYIVFVVVVIFYVNTCKYMQLYEISCVFPGR